jgi:hypothetical protein
MLRRNKRQLNSLISHHVYMRFTLNISKLFYRFIAWMRSPTDFRMERYLARSVDVADLEHRLQKWSRMSEADKNHYGFR